MATTDPQNEMFPVVNAADEVIGQITRQEAHQRTDIIHRAVCILVFNDKDEVLIQQRSMSKDKYPGTWELGVGGHVSYGDTYMATAIRELKEETGLGVTTADLHLLGKILIHFQTETEFWEVYRCNIADKQIAINTEEVMATRFVSLDELSKMIMNPGIKWKPNAIRMFKEFLDNPSVA